MKTVFKVIITIAIFGIMGFFSQMSFSLNYSRFFFAGGSVESLMAMPRSNIYLQIGFVIVCFLFWILFLKNHHKINLTLFVLFFLLWLMSGRSIGILYDGRVKSGWFYFQTKEFTICPDSLIDCETVMGYQTAVKKLPFWRLEIRNAKVDKVIFVGPILWRSTYKLFRKKIGSGAYTISLPPNESPPQTLRGKEN